MGGSRQPLFLSVHTDSAAASWAVSTERARVSQLVGELTALLQVALALTLDVEL